MGTWDIAYIAGPVGTCQYGPGYGCIQKVEGKSGVGHAIIRTDGGQVREVELAAAGEAKAISRTIPQWCIAYIKGPAGTCQYGHGYGCIQKVETKSGVGQAIVKMQSSETGR